MGPAARAGAEGRISNPLPTSAGGWAPAGSDCAASGVPFPKGFPATVEAASAAAKLKPPPAPTPIDHHTRRPKLRGVQFAARGLVVYCQREIHKEIHMYTKTAFMSAWPVLGAAVVACTLFA